MKSGGPGCTIKLDRSEGMNVMLLPVLEKDGERIWPPGLHSGKIKKNNQLK